VRPTMRENVRFWVKAIVVILILRAFIFEPFRIPSESMEGTLLNRDFLIVSKLHYGARTPNTIGIPFTQIYLPGIEFPQTRLPGFSSVQRGDVVVFNYPSATDVERGRIAEDVPVERRAPYIKRVVGVPGDTLAVLDKVLHIDGQPVPLAPTMKQRWRMTMTGQAAPPPAALEDLGVDFFGAGFPDSTGVLAVDIAATPTAARALDGRADVASVVPFVLPEGAPQMMVYPQTSGWNADQYGPVVVPGQGMTVALDAATWPVYSEVIARYEGHTASVGPGGEYLVDGRAATRYTFAQDYYFAMGDSRDNSVDSRFWGFVPKSHVVGRALFTFLSFKSWLPPIPRFERFFRPIP
jgi:signal peptidase I